MVTHGDRKLTKQDIDPKYQQGYVYYIVDHLTDEAYVGSSTITKAKRLSIHKSKTAKHKCSSKAIIERGNYTFAIVEYYPCWSKAELDEREEWHRSRFWLKRKVINQNRAFISEAERKVAQKEYYEANRERLLAYKHDWYGSNKDRILTQQQQYREENQEHIRNWHKQNYQNKKEQIQARQKQYVEKNKEAVAAQKKKWYEANKERINAQRREKAKQLKTEV